MGRHYLGEGVERNLKAANHYFQDAKKKLEDREGECDSCDLTSLAELYEYGLGCDADEACALKNYIAAKKLILRGLANTTKRQSTKGSLRRRYP